MGKLFLRFPELSDWSKYDNNFICAGYFCSHLVRVRFYSETHTWAIYTGPYFNNLFSSCNGAYHKGDWYVVIMELTYKDVFEEFLKFYPALKKQSKTL